MQNYINVPIIPYGLVAGTVSNGTIAVGTSLIWVMPIPSDALGGGITITEFKPYCNGTIAANIMDISLVTLGTVDTVVGTVAHLGSALFGFGGLKNYYSALGTVVTQQSTGFWCDQDAGHYGLAVQVKQVAVLAVGSSSLNVSIGWQQGRG